MKFWILPFVLTLAFTKTTFADMVCTFHHEDGREDTFPSETSNEFDEGNTTTLQRLEVDDYIFELTALKTIMYLEVLDKNRKMLAQTQTSSPGEDNINLFYDGFFIDCTSTDAEDLEMEETEPVDPT